MATETILIIDDSPMTRKRERAMLEPLPATIVEAVNGAEGLAAASRHPLDLIITDLDMPFMDGIELCRNLKQHRATKGIPVIMVSSFDTDQDIERGFQAGVTEYIPKAEAGERLLTAARNILTNYSFRRDRTILVVDDSVTIRQAVEECLLQAGFQVVTAANGALALDAVARRKPDLILSDAMMPELDGAELCRRLRAQPDTAGIPFVAMSSVSERAQMARMINRGAVAYLVKPFNLDQLVIMLDKFLSDQFLLLLKEKERLDAEQRLLLQGISSLVSALEARDPYTRGHSEAVAEILTRIAVFAGVTPEEVGAIAIGGRLHDLGKIGVRDSVLLKNGKLTAEEYDHIKTHPGTGARILDGIASLAASLPIIEHHHERWDGRGYPAGQRGDQIHRWARLAAVADTYHALVSIRPYRDGMKHEQALRIINEVAGTQLCPESVELFLSWLSTLNEAEIAALAAAPGAS